MTSGSSFPRLGILKTHDLSSCSKSRWDLKETMEFYMLVAHFGLLNLIEECEFDVEKGASLLLSSDSPYCPEMF